MSFNTGGLIYSTEGKLSFKHRFVHSQIAFKDSVYIYGAQSALQWSSIKWGSTVSVGNRLVSSEISFANIMKNFLIVETHSSSFNCFTMKRTWFVAEALFHFFDFAGKSVWNWSQLYFLHIKFEQWYCSALLKFLHYSLFNFATLLQSSLLTFLEASNFSCHWTFILEG